MQELWSIILYFKSFFDIEMYEITLLEANLVLIR